MLPIFKKRRIRVDILTIFLALFLTSVITIACYSYVRSGKAILEVAEQLIARTNESILEKLDHFIKPASFVNVANFLLSDEILALSDMQSLTSFMHIMLDSYPQLTNAYLADTQGNMFIENQVSDDPTNQNVFPFHEKLHMPKGTKYISEVIDADHVNSNITVTYKNLDGEFIGKEKFIYHYDPRLRPWYIGAKQNGDQQWIGIYETIGAQKQILSIAFPIFIKGKFSGVAAVDLSVDLITQELKKFSTTDHSLVFIINNKGEIITSATNLLRKKVTRNDKNPNDDLIATAYEKHQTENAKYFMFDSEGEQYIAHFSPFALTANEHWEIGTIIPVEAFVGAVNHANQRILFFSLIMTILGIGLIIFSSHTISKPIMQLADETKKMTKLDFRKKIVVKSHIYEVRVLGAALIAAQSALSSFVKYVPKVLVEQLMRTKLIAQLGGKKQEITVLFSDITNFTSIAEQADPEFLMHHLSEYLNALTEIIQKYTGNIDKYVGDAIMAFWGAPLEDAHQIKHACLAAIACRNEVHRLNQEWSNAGKPIFLTRFGLHAGQAIVGNVGSSDRLNYTAVGDTVNVAARLVDMNKTYNTEIIVSEAIYSQCKNDFEFKMLGTVEVRGKKHPVPIYELIL